MSGWDDLPVEMRGERIDADTMDRLLRGRITPDDAPPGYSDVASILLAAASLPTKEDRTVERQHVTAARDVIARRSFVRRARHRRLAATFIVIGALGAIPGLAMANALPDPAQHAVSTVLDKVGISVPQNGDHPVDAGIHPASTGADVSNLATTTDATGVAKGAAISSLASGGKSQAGTHGQASTHEPPVSTPDGGGTGTADTASGGNSAGGAATADEHSNGHGAAASTHAPHGP